MSSIPADTTPEAYAVQQAIFDKMEPGRRVELAFEMSAAMRQTAMAGIRAQNPSYTDRQVVLEYARMTLGEALFRKAFADEAALIER